MVLKILAKIGINAFALWVAHKLVGDVVLRIAEEPLFALLGLAGAGLALWLANELIKPLLKVLTFPLILVTFGLFNIVINILVLWGVDAILPQLTISGLVPLIWTTLIISIVNGLLFFV